MYPDDKVVRFVTENFIPARVHLREQAEDFKRFGDRFGAHWTPAILELDPDGTERFRVEGFLEAPELLAQLTLGLGKAAFASSRWDDAERRFREVLSRYLASDAAPEALYWAGVSRYRATGDAKALADTAAAFGERFQETTWAKKSSIWKA